MRFARILIAAVLFILAMAFTSIAAAQGPTDEVAEESFTIQVPAVQPRGLFAMAESQSSDVTITARVRWFRNKTVKTSYICNSSLCNQIILSARLTAAGSVEFDGNVSLVEGEKQFFSRKLGLVNGDVIQLESFYLDQSLPTVSSTFYAETWPVWVSLAPEMLNPPDVCQAFWYKYDPEFLIENNFGYSERHPGPDDEGYILITDELANEPVMDWVVTPFDKQGNPRNRVEFSNVLNPCYTPPPLACENNEASIDSETQVVTGFAQGSVTAVRWEVIRTEDGAVMADGSGNTANYEFQGAFETGYQVVFIDQEGNSTTGCEFSFPPIFEPPPSTPTPTPTPTLEPPPADKVFCRAEVSQSQNQGQKQLVRVWAVNENEEEIPFLSWRMEGPAGYKTGMPEDLPVWVKFEKTPGVTQVEKFFIIAETVEGIHEVTSDECVVKYEYVTDQPHQEQLVKSGGSQIALLDYLKSISDTAAIEDYHNKFGDLVAEVDPAMVDPRMFNVPRWLINPTDALYWRYIINGNPVGIEGKGLGITLDGTYRSNGHSLADATLYQRNDYQKALGIWMYEEVKGSTEQAGPKSAPAPGTQGHFEHHFAPEPWVIEVALEVEVADEEWEVQQYRHMAETSRLYAIFSGFTAGNREMNMAWQERGQYSGLMDYRKPMTRWPDDLESYPSVSYSSLYYDGLTFTYWGVYGVSGIEFAWNPYAPNPWMYDEAGELVISNEDYNLLLDNIPGYQYVGGRVMHDEAELINYEITVARLMVKYGMEGRYLAYVPPELVGEVGSAGSGIDYAHLYKVQAEVKTLEQNAINSTLGLANYQKSLVKFEDTYGLGIANEDVTATYVIQSNGVSATLTLPSNPYGVKITWGNGAAETVEPGVVVFTHLFTDEGYTGQQFEDLRYSRDLAIRLAEDARAFADAEQIRIEALIAAK